MNPQDPNNNQQFNNSNQNPNDFNMGNNQQMTSQPQDLSQQSQQFDQGQGGQDDFVPYMAFPANMKRDFDPGIYNMIAELVDKKYGAEIHPAAREFEIIRTYNKVEIEMFELSTFSLSKDKQEELQRMTESAQNSGGNQQETIMKIREYMQSNVPNITELVNQYMIGFRNQYMAGRY